MGMNDVIEWKRTQVGVELSVSELCRYRYCCCCFFFLFLVVVVQSFLVTVNALIRSTDGTLTGRQKNSTSNNNGATPTAYRPLAKQGGCNSTVFDGF